MILVRRFATAREPDVNGSPSQPKEQRQRPVGAAAGRTDDGGCQVQIGEKRVSHRPPTRRSTCAGQRADRPFPQAAVTQDPLDDVPLAGNAWDRSASQHLLVVRGAESALNSGGRPPAGNRLARPPGWGHLGPRDAVRRCVSRCLPKKPQTDLVAPSQTGDRWLYIRFTSG
jgi:hypothetical protein